MYVKLALASLLAVVCAGVLSGSSRITIRLDLLHPRVFSLDFKK